jgi:hypothetical protein
VDVVRKSEGGCTVGGAMKPMVIAILTVIAFLSTFPMTPCYAQAPSTDQTPTFYRLVPGTYVNGWPRFTITYPKDWVEKRPMAFEVFRAEAPPSAPRSALSVNVFPNPNPIDKVAEIVILPFFRTAAQDVTIVRDNPIQLRDGTPAREVETKMIMNGEPIRVLNVATKSGDMWVNTGTRSYTGKIEEYQRAMLYSLRYEPDKDRPVTIPPDVQEFFDKHANAVLSHDLTQIMSQYSDRYLNSGMRKGELERFWKQSIGAIVATTGGTTDFVQRGDIAYLAGFGIMNGQKWPMFQSSVIKENGEWKFYGNQRDVTP